MKTTKGSVIHRGYKIAFKTKEKDGLWQCSARCTADNGSFGLTVFDSESISGFASREDAEKATLDAMKDWIDIRSSRSEAGLPISRNRRVFGAM